LSGDGVVFVLDSEALKRRYKIVPVDYYAGSTRPHGSYGSARSEAEEFVIGGIKEVDRYIVEIRIPKGIYEWMLRENDDYYNPEEDSPYWPVTSYTKLKII
jgi:hypothetical protein